MDITDIKPYPRNARHNEKAIPVVAESIKEFGFKGVTVLRSRDDPTIVNGHTRVAACKLLGWTEFPDEYIRYADDLTDEQVRALRLADNRTGEVATWQGAAAARGARHQVARHEPLQLRLQGQGTPVRGGEAEGRPRVQPRPRAGGGLRNGWVPGPGPGGREA